MGDQRARVHRALAFEQHKTSYQGESPVGHFNNAVDHLNDDKHAVHNGMNEEPGIPRFGADDYDG